VAVLGRWGVGAEAAPAFERLIEALANEPDPPTTVREPVAILARHVADSLAGLEVDALSAARSVVDVGAGAGFPGLALALARPAAGPFDLVESARRKSEVIERLIAASGAANARVVMGRAEDWGGEHREAYDAVTARAVAALPVLCEYAAPLLHPGGVLVAWKGARDQGEERAGARAAAELGLRSVDVLLVHPFADAHSRHLHVYEKVAPTPARFPRRAGMAAKRPLA
jgi:16S rRNA (guanine527-N7)-methyltransferase